MINSFPRRTLDEVIFLYKHEPSLYDIYVEGPFDASIIRWLISELNFKYINIYEISTIQIEKENLLQSNIKDNNKGRIEYLAKYFQENLTGSKQIACVIDKDFDHILDKMNGNQSIFYTDFTAMEMYFYNENILGKFMSIVCNKMDWPVNDILSSLTEVLKKMFIYRLVNETLQWEMAMLNDISCIDIDEWAMDFNEDEYITKLLNKNNFLHKKKEFLNERSKFETLLLEDDRLQIHGHDFIKLFCWYITKKGVSRARINEKHIARSLALALSLDYLLEFDLFNHLNAFSNISTIH